MSEKQSKALERVTIRFAGDSGDGMQLTGGQFTITSALAGNDLITLPDYPAEIRAPAGTLYGVSGFQIQLSSGPVHTPGDEPDVLVAMNPAALKVNLKLLRHNGIIIVNTDAFTEKNLKLAGFESNPLQDGSLSGYQVFQVPITTLTREALKDVPISMKDKDRSKNFFALGITYWMFTRPLEPTLNWIKEKFKNKPELIDANTKALQAGYSYALATEIFTTSYRVEKAHKRPGTYRNITGNEAIALGFIAAAAKAGKELFQGSYPITPASEILHELSKYRNYGVKTFQAEDEIAGIGSALGAAYAGDVAITTTSGPGLALKSEFMGLAVITELPLVIVNVQRGGPSTGLPTKMEQADLLQSMWGRNGEAPIPIIAAKSPADCFGAAFEAVQVAFKFTTPVLLLTDGYIANGAEPWLIPNEDELPEIEIKYADNPEGYMPYKRDPETLARYMAIPGMPKFEHHIGGLEKDETGNVSYDPENHDRMVRLRAEKVERVKDFVKEPELYGDPEGDLLIVSWGSTYGVVYNAIEEIEKKGKKASWIHLRWINPLPKMLGKYIHNFKNVLVPEVNLGQLSRILRMEYLVDVKGFNKVRGLPLNTHEVVDEIESYLKG
ncbi:MAG TPA: 2-oxoacid:acceptor oxidoreductase subunit alpha [Caldithrix abyssi]|uniref:2-oxoacid:acceptor oxidoreductase subunit alpha n=1 Tax=Caldithrix abyssi TaxID=187145 RepID=A0A7V5UEE0_CALAY|nr:2-oxoacid:acceptor oxidoreductase subunit alpha [Caldithrix abyssi]